MRTFNGEDAPRGDRSSGCSCCCWAMALLIVPAFFMVMMSIPPADSIPGIRDLEGLPPYDDPTTCSVELAGVRGLGPALAPGAISPGFDLVVHVNNGHYYTLRHDNGGDVVVSYAGVPLARGRTPSFRLAPGNAGYWAVNATGAGLGIPADLSRLMAAERRWGVAQLEIDLGITCESFTCDVLIDGQPGASPCRLASS